MHDLPFDYVIKEVELDYTTVGQNGFLGQPHPKLKTPAVDSPSLQWLAVSELVYQEKYVNRVPFQVCLARVPGCSQDLSGDKFEDWIYTFAQGKHSQVFSGFPNRIESFPLVFEDPFSQYLLTANTARGTYDVKKLRQPKSETQFQIQCNIARKALVERGIEAGNDFNTLVTVAQVNGSSYDDYLDTVSKTYSDEVQLLPFRCLIQRREKGHYLDIDQRVASRMGRVATGKPLVCYNESLMGVMATALSQDARTLTLKVEINAMEEESKLHNPFISENFLRQAVTSRSRSQAQAKKNGGAAAARAEADEGENPLLANYYGDHEIEMHLGLPQGVVNKLTGSLLVAFDEEGKEERQVVDLGLNLKNFTKKVHIPDFVRFIAPNQSASASLDDYNHNQLARGSRHVRKHWEYSERCYAIIEEYVRQYPEVVELIGYLATQKSRAINSLRDLYPDIAKADKKLAITKVRTILGWIEALPISKLPYVEIGFDTLDSSLVKALQNYSQYVLQNFDTVDLKARQTEVLPLSMVYQENFPYWFPPQPAGSVSVEQFRIGNRVMNLNSHLRQFVPFGMRGTVVGKTEHQVIVMFDEQFLHGSDIYGHCDEYRGAYVRPDYLLNLTQSFAQIAQDNKALAKKFQERPLRGCPQFQEEAKYQEPVRDDGESQGVSRRQEHLARKYNLPRVSRQSAEESKRAPASLKQDRDLEPFVSLGQP